MKKIRKLIQYIFIFVFLNIIFFTNGIQYTYAAISLVSGGALNGQAANGANVTLTFPVGVQTGDVVILYGGHPHRAATNIGPSTSGYTQIAVHTAAAPNFGVWYKIMGSTPDSTVVGQGTGSAQDATAYGAYILRDVDGAVFDQVSVTAGPTTGTNPDAAAIVTQTANAWVIAMAGSQVLDAAVTVPAGYGNLNGNSGDDNNDISVHGATILKASAGSENPPVFTNWASGAWYAITIALKPSDSPTVNTEFANQIGATSAIINGAITSGGSITQHGIAYGTVSSLTTVIATSSKGVYSGLGSFADSIGSLSQNTTYYFRAYATNALGTGYGEIKSFTTGNTSIARKMLLFQGFKIKITNGKIILRQK